MAGTIKVDTLQSDSNLALKIATANVAFIDATGINVVGGNLSVGGTQFASGGQIQTAGIADGAVTNAKITSNPTFTGNTTVTTLITGAGTVGAPSIAPTGDLNTGIYFPAADNIAITTGGTARLNVNATGQITTPTQVGFMAYIPTNQSIPNNTETKIDLNTESYDIGSVFNTSTATFTAPVAGRYLVIGAVSMAGAEQIHCGLWVNGTNDNPTPGLPSGYLQMSDLAIADSTQQAIVNMRILNLSANDYVNLYTYHNSGGSKNAVGQRCFLNIMLLG